MSSALLPVYARKSVAFEKGEGSFLISTEGERFLDFGSGVAVNNLGHAHPHLVATLKAQAEKLWHTSNQYQSPEGERLAQRLCALSFADQVFFTNSGAESLECAIKMARKYHSAKGAPQKYRLITFEGAFHGRTLATIAAGGQTKYLEGFGPAVQGFDQVPLGDWEAVKNAITEETAGILLEPIQGEGGIRSFSHQDLRFLRELTTERGLLLVLDEVQCGMGRTGKLFAYEWAGITPDILATAKGIGGGFPLGACLATFEAAQGMTLGAHGSTFGGNTLAVAVGNAVLDEIAKPEFLEHVRHISLLMKQKLAALKDLYPNVISEVRGDGLLLGLKCVVPNTTLVDEALAEKLLILAAGDNVVRLIPPLTLSSEEVAEGITKLEIALARLSEKRV